MKIDNGQITSIKKTRLHTAVLCLTHRCNLNCVYCFENKDSGHEMSEKVAFKCIDRIVTTHCKNIDDKVSLNLFGGEPLIRFDLIKSIYSYVYERYPEKISIFISTNGTLLDDEMKSWFWDRKDRVCLGLSLDGDRVSQNLNRSNSFDLIDIAFFAKTWPNQSFKMTVSEQSVENYAHDVMFIHSFGVGINGGDFCVGAYKWNDDRYYYTFAQQLKQLIGYYEKHPESKNSLLNLDLAACTVEPFDRKCCGCGTSISYYETDGKCYPCTFIAPMGFCDDDIQEMMQVDFSNPCKFTDQYCKNHCYLNNICMTCAAEDYIQNKSFSIHSKRNCGIKKIIALAVADLESRRIINLPNLYSNDKIFYTIEAIKKIKELYWTNYRKYFEEEAENL